MRPFILAGAIVIIVILAIALFVVLVDRLNRGVKDEKKQIVQDYELKLLYDQIADLTRVRKRREERQEREV